MLIPLLLTMNVLIAEDQQDAASIYRIALESRGHHVIVTYDGQQCLQTYENAASKMADTSSLPYDVVILDYRMPKLDGLQAAKAILAIKPEQRIIFASAYVKETLHDSVRDLEKIVELIEKPFEPKTLVELVENVSSIQQLREINDLVESMDVSDMSIKTADVRKGIERMRTVFGPAILKSLTTEFEEKGVLAEHDEWYSAGHLQSHLKSIFGDHTGIFLMRFFIGYFKKHPQIEGGT